jgi:aminoglycoside N3'-acetyltransferase
MKYIQLDDLLTCFSKLGIHHGDVLLVHSAIQFLGKPQGGVNLYYQALCTALGLPDAGLLAVPTFNFGFARGAGFDPEQTPAKNMGVLSEFIRGLPEAYRTRHPLQSLAAIGPQAASLAEQDTSSAFDPGSAFERLLELDGKLLLLGASIQACSIIHYSEQRSDVPYRYWKTFTGSVWTPQGWQTRSYRMFVRDLKINAQLSLAALQAVLEAEGAWRSVELNYGLITVCPMRAFVTAADRLLSSDPWVFVTNR